jgi:hypothetical protein
MRQRCRSKNTVGWAGYGGRGIKVCRRWRDSFAAFLEDMGPKPSKKHSIDRKDVNGNYEPSNCQWATKTEQARNCRSNRQVSLNGRTMCISAWAEHTGLPPEVIRARLNLRWSPEKTLTTPLYASRRDQRFLTYKDRTQTVKQWAREVGVGYTTLLYRLSNNWSDEDTINRPVDTAKRSKT